jgi:hypothetical protein
MTGYFYRLLLLPLSRGNHDTDSFTIEADETIVAENLIHTGDDLSVQILIRVKQ